MTLKSRKVFSAVHTFIIITSLVSSPLAQAPRERLGIRQTAAQEPRQTEEEKKAAKELERKALALIDELVVDTMSLRRADNRAYVLAVASDLLWDRDEGRARALAREAMNQAVAHLREAKEEVVERRSELSNALPDTASTTRAEALYRLASSASTLRSVVLDLLASRDAKLALEFLRLASPLSWEEKEEKKQEAEKRLELRLASLTVESDPQTALQIAEKYRGDKPDYQFITLWRALLGKNPKAAASLTERVIGDLKSRDLADSDASDFVYHTLDVLRSRAGETADTRDNPDTSNATRLVSAEIQQAYRDALEVVVAAALKVTAAQLEDKDILERRWARDLLGRVQRLLPDIEKHLPSRAPAVRAKLAQFPEVFPGRHVPRGPSWEEVKNMIENKSPDELMAIAAEFQDGVFKPMLYRNAATKFIRQGDTARARQVLKDFLLNDMDSGQFFAEIEFKEREQAMKEGKLEEARKNVSRLRWSEERALAWIELARKAEADKDQKLRRESLAEAGEFLGDQMEAQSQIAARLELAAASVDLDPDRCFEILGSAIDRLNTTLNAVMTVVKFNRKILTPDGVVTESGDMDGEIALGDLYDFTQVLDQRLLAFAQTDFDRAALALKRLEVDVIRVRTCLLLLDRVLRAEPRHDHYNLPLFLRR
jgi:hypothetical protein